MMSYQYTTWRECTLLLLVHQSCSTNMGLRRPFQIIFLNNGACVLDNRIFLQFFLFFFSGKTRGKFRIWWLSIAWETSPVMLLVNIRSAYTLSQPHCESASSVANACATSSEYMYSVHVQKPLLWAKTETNRIKTWLNTIMYMHMCIWGEGVIEAKSQDIFTCTCTR